MSGFPPPPPGGVPPPYSAADWKAQRRLVNAQRKAFAAQQKAQYRLQRAQMRAGRRGSIVGPLLLVALGIVFLLTQTGSLSWGHVIAWYTRWWPAVMIAAGLLLIGEWGFARQRQQEGLTTYGPVLGGGVVFLLLLLASVGWSLRFANAGYDWGHHFAISGWERMMGEAHEADSTLDSAIATGQPLMVRCPHGDVVITGSSQDGRVHVSVHKQVYVWNDNDAADKERQLEPQFSTVGGQLQLTVPAQEGGQADLNLEVPRETTLTVEANRGDITVHELHAPVTLTANRGDIEMAALSGPVAIHVTHDSASISGHSLNGDVSVEGRSGDINFSDVTGSVSLHGDFFGTTHLERVNGQVRFETSRTQFQAARLDGEFEVDTGADLQANELAGPVVLTTRNRNIELDRVSGHVQITNRNGSVTVTQTTPFAGIQVRNDRGSVDVGIPTGAAFVLEAQTRHGDVENDFGLSRTGPDDSPALKGTIGSGGPLVSLQTSDGDVTVRKSSVLPLPPKPPVPPRITSLPKPPITPEAPKPPIVPEVPAPHAPTIPKTPRAPAAPATP